MRISAQCELGRRVLDVKERWLLPSNLADQQRIVQLLRKHNCLFNRCHGKALPTQGNTRHRRCCGSDNINSNNRVAAFVLFYTILKAINDHFFFHISAPLSNYTHSDRGGNSCIPALGTQARNKRTVNWKPETKFHARPQPLSVTGPFGLKLSC